MVRCRCTLTQLAGEIDVPLEDVIAALSEQGYEVNRRGSHV